MKTTPVKYHKHLVEEILHALQAIFGESKYADKVIEKTLKNQRKWGARDRRFFAENVYEGVRWWRRNWHLLQQEPDLAMPSLLRFWAMGLLLSGQDLPEWSELQSLRENKNEILKRSRDLPLALQESIPDWMNEWGQQQRGPRWSAVLHALNEKSCVDLRVNTLKSNRQKLIQSLRDEEIETEVIGEFALTLKERKNIFKTKAFSEGWFEVQDRASQQVAPMMQLQPGLRVVDACAGAGGKTMHMATLMNNKGKIIALDIHEWKLNELKTRARRDGIDIIETRVLDSNKVVKRLKDSADRLLLDVPCSGMGVLRRNPDSKWKLSQERVASLLALQAEILQDYAPIVKPGGIMVYATCSLMPIENEEQIEKFLKASPLKWEKIQQLKIDPDQGLGDGFFAQSLRRLE